MRDRWTSLAIAIAVLIAVGAAVAGIALNHGDAVSNLLAELAGLAAAFVAGLLVFDRLAERRRATQWARVRSLTMRGIAARLVGAFTNAYIYLPVRHHSMTWIQDGTDKPSDKALDGYRDLATQMAALTEAKSGSPDKSASDLVVECYEAAQWDLDQIQLVLFPRVIESSADQQLIDALTDFDEARRSLHDAIIGHKLVVTGAPLPACVQLCQSGARLYQVLCRVWRE